MNGAASLSSTKTFLVLSSVVLSRAPFNAFQRVSFGATMRAVMEALKQRPIRELTKRYGKVIDGIYRDTVAPFGCQRTDYLNCCRFSNEIQKAGVMSAAIAVLPNQNKGFRLSLTGSASQYEILLEGGSVKLGLIREHQPRLLLASGSASAETTWTRFAEVIKEKEGK
jgi:hypothetical protein